MFPAECSMKKSEQFDKKLFNHCLKTTAVCFTLRIVRWLLIKIEFYYKFDELA